MSEEHANQYTDEGDHEYDHQQRDDQSRQENDQRRFAPTQVMYRHKCEYLQHDPVDERGGVQQPKVRNQAEEAAQHAQWRLKQQADIALSQEGSLPIERFREQVDQPHPDEEPQRDADDPSIGGTVRRQCLNRCGTEVASEAIADAREDRLCHKPQDGRDDPPADVYISLILREDCLPTTRGQPSAWFPFFTRYSPGIHP